MVERRAWFVGLALLLVAACSPAAEALDAATPDTVPDARDADPDRSVAPEPGEPELPEVIPEPAVELADAAEVAEPSPEAPDAVEPVADSAEGGEAVGDAAHDLGPPVPPALSLTVDAVPAAMNGSGPFLSNDPVETPFHLAVPRRGFTLDVTVEPGSGAIDPASLVVTADAPVGELPAGTDLGPRFTWLDASHARWLVDLDLAPAWPVTVTAQAADLQGTPSPGAALAFEVRELTPDLDPFEQPNLWLLDFRRDVWSIAVADSAEGFSVTSTPAPQGNGVGDFDEMLRALGFLGPDPVFDAAFLARFRAEVRANVRLMFLQQPDGSFTDDSVRVQVVFDGEPDAPDPGEYSDAGAFSMMAIGGDSLNPDGTPSGYLGMSWIDWNNRWQDDNTSVKHGVFFTALMRKTASFAGLKPLLGLIVPGTGAPLGALEGDLLLLDPGYTPPNDADLVHKKRATLVKLFFKVGGIGLAALTVHEMGHSLGLVKPGAPPEGLFGGACEASFAMTCSDGAHLDIAGANLMQSGKSLNVGDFLTSYPRFEPLSLAYLQRRLVVE